MNVLREIVTFLNQRDFTRLELFFPVKQATTKYTSLYEAILENPDLDNDDTAKEMLKGKINKDDDFYKLKALFRVALYLGW